MGFSPSLGSIPDVCGICKQKVQLWNFAGTPAANGLLILDPELDESVAYHFSCAQEKGYRWVTVHLGYFMNSDKEGDEESAGGA